MLAKNIHVRLGQEGFCSPSESTEAGQTEKLEGGTGLGEGSGAENISKDIADDEDLSELAQQGQEDNDEDMSDDQQEGVNMDHDELEGGVGNAPENEQHDSGSEAGQDDIEDETGDVDELDPGAVDEKLWDGDHDRDENEKQGRRSETLGRIMPRIPLLHQIKASRGRWRRRK